KRQLSLFSDSQGTEKGVVPVPHDKFKFMTCVYVAPRTLIKCKEIRPSEIMAKTKGICEMHEGLQRICHKQGELENQLIQFEVEKKGQVDYEEVLRLGDKITEVVPFLTEKDKWSGDIADVVNMECVMEAEDNPLRNSELLSEKEIIRGQLAALKRHNDKLKDAREKNEEKARRRMHELNAFVEFPLKKETKEELGVDETNENPFSLLNKDETNRDMPVCSYEWEVDGKRKKCTHDALPSTHLCSKHTVKRSEQKVFAPCKICRAPTIDFGHEDVLCLHHQNSRLRSEISPGGTTRSYRVKSTPISTKNTPSWHTYDGNSPTGFNTIILDDDTVAEENERTKNERLKETPVPQKPTSSRKRPSEAVPPKTSAPPPTMKHDPAFMAAIMGTNAVANRRKSYTVDNHSMTCARVRPFAPQEFGRHKLLQKPSQMQPRTPRSGIVQLSMAEVHSMGPPPGTILSPSIPPSHQNQSSQSTHGPSINPSSLPSTSRLPHPPSSVSFLNSSLPPSQSTPSRNNQLIERPNVRLQPLPETPEHKEPPRSSHSSFSSSSRQDQIGKMYGKGAFVPGAKREPPKLPVGSNRPPNRNSFPLGKGSMAVQYGRSLAAQSSTSTSQSTLPSPRLPPSKTPLSLSSSTPSRPPLPPLS
ncbi:hypothetical protein PFISCL1PPCAC_10624, partial [Pristionchus fissidentatus]